MRTNPIWIQLFFKAWHLSLGLMATNHIYYTACVCVCVCLCECVVAAKTVCLYAMHHVLPITDIISSLRPKHLHHRYFIFMVLCEIWITLPWKTKVEPSKHGTLKLKKRCTCTMSRTLRHLPLENLIRNGHQRKYNVTTHEHKYIYHIYWTVIRSGV